MGLAESNGSLLMGLLTGRLWTDCLEMGSALALSLVMTMGRGLPFSLVHSCSV